MLRKYRYGFAVFILAAILITLFPPMTYIREVPTGGDDSSGMTTYKVSYNVGFIYLFSWYAAGHSDPYVDSYVGEGGNVWYHYDRGSEVHSSFYVNRGLITLEYILAVLLGAAIGLVRVFVRRGE